MPVWVLPGGGIEQSETPEYTVIREAHEETGFRVTIDKKVGEYKYHGLDKINYTFICTVKGGKRATSKESEFVEYTDLSKLPDLMSPFAKTMISDALMKKPEVIEKTFDKLPISFWIKGLRYPWAFFKYILIKMGVHWNS